jgi:uncharacterized protein YndB with AHSA1/START domain
MNDIRHRVGIDAPIAEVYDAIATAAGTAQWWTRDVTGESTVGGALTFSFGGPERSATMELVELTPPDRIVWRCVHGPDEWIGLTFTFDLRADGDETVLLFTNDGWAEPVEFMHHCTTAWGYYLLSLKHGLEGSKATPWPDNEKISSWG